MFYTFQICIATLNFDLFVTLQALSALHKDECYLKTTVRSSVCYFMFFSLFFLAAERNCNVSLPILPSRRKIWMFLKGPLNALKNLTLDYICFGFGWCRNHSHFENEMKIICVSLCTVKGYFPLKLLRRNSIVL